MSKIKPGYKTLIEVAGRQCGQTEGQWLDEVNKELKQEVLNLLEYAANRLLKIWDASDYRAKIDPLGVEIISALKKQGIGDSDCHAKSSAEPLPANYFEYYLKGGQPLSNTYTGYIITNEELCRFETEHGIHIHTKEDYPKELRIAVEIWNKVFAHGLTPRNPPLNRHNMVRDELKAYKLEDKGERIRYIIVADKSTSPVTEPTTTEHTRNEQGHPHHAPLLEIAVKLWEECKGLVPYKRGAETWLGLFHEGLTVRQKDGILELTNPTPGGGRPKKGV